MCDMDARIGIAHPEWLDIAGPDGTVTRGADQDWYGEPWQRRAGCGPTTAAVIFSYLARAHTALANLCPADVSQRSGFVTLMEQVWNDITPGPHGLNQPDKMVEGMAAYGRARGIDLSPALFCMPAARTKRPPYERAAEFIMASLARDCPVAFLNLDNGREKRLDRWHWVTVIGLGGGRAEILDCGQGLDIDLRLWYETSKKRGGFVSVLGGEA